MPERNNAEPRAADPFERTLETHLQTWRDVTPPPSLQARIAAAAVVPPSGRRNSWRPLMAAGICAAAALGTFLAWPGSPVQPVPAFAEIEKSMKAVNSMAHRSEVETKFGDGHIDHSSGQAWLQRHPPASVSRTYERCAHGKELRKISIADAQGYAEQDEKTGKWKVGPNREDLAASIERTIFIFTHPGKDEKRIRPVWRALGIQVSPWHAQKAVLDGRSTWLFTRTTRKHETRKALTITDVSALRLWADITTHRVLRCELDMSYEKNGKKDESLGYRRIVNSEFSYNTPPPPGLRDIHPPREQAHGTSRP